MRRLELLRRKSQSGFGAGGEAEACMDTIDCCPWPGDDVEARQAGCEEHCVVYGCMGVWVGGHGERTQLEFR